MARAASHYCAQVNKHLTCPDSLKKPFLRQLRDEVSFYCEEHGEADLSALYAQFGSPEDVAEEFLAELSPQTVATYANRRRKILLAALAIAIFAAITAVLLSIRSRQMQQKLDEEDFIASITYEDDSSIWAWPPFRDILFGQTGVSK